MTIFTYRLPDGSERTVDAKEGLNAMQAAILNQVPGIIGECGGSAMCATCHVYVEQGADILPPVSDIENDMLDCTATARDQRSRLSCQIIADDTDQVIVLRLPDLQV